MTEHFTATFGPWRLRTTRTNIREATLSGPFRWYRAIGVRLSLSDRGRTFGTNVDRGVCTTFWRPVPALLPLGVVRHRALTVTVVEPERLAAVL